MIPTAPAAEKPTRKPKRLRESGGRVIYPRGLEVRYGISLSTRWRWEKDRLLPPRDVFIGGKAVGWKPETLDAADSGQAA